MFKTWFVNIVNKYFVCKCYWVDFTALPGVIETLSNCGNLKVVLDCWYNSISLMFQNYFTLILHWGLFPLKIGRFIAYCNHSSLCYQRLASLLLSAVMMIWKIWWCWWGWWCNMMKTLKYHYGYHFSKHGETYVEMEFRIYILLLCAVNEDYGWLWAIIEID